MNTPKINRWATAAFGLLLAGLAQAELAIIAHPDNPEPALTMKQLKLIYLAKTKTFPQGGAVRYADQREGSPARAEFLPKVLKKKEKQLRTYWSKMIFTGRGTPPEVVGGDAEVKQWVTQHPDALGYIDAGQVDDSIKVLLLIP